jgi:hypothetical protein
MLVGTFLMTGFFASSANAQNLIANGAFTPNPEGGGGVGQGIPAVPAWTETDVIAPGVF